MFKGGVKWRALNLEKVVTKNEEHENRLKNIKQQEYSRMELGRRNSAVEKRFRHKPYGIGE